MLRRSLQPAVAAVSSSKFSTSSATLSTASRTYFSAGTGEVGIWGNNMGRLIKTLTIAVYFVCPLFMWKMVIRRYNPDKQWISMSTDKWYSDGTVMTGDEATANLRLQRERIMPIMDQYLEKIESSKGH